MSRASGSTFAASLLRWGPLWLALGSSPALAAEITLQGSAIRITGAIERGDLRKLQALLATPEGARAFETRGTFILDSPGGQVVEALEIAQVMEGRFATTVVPSGAKCYSACFLLYAAGSYRAAGEGAALGVHQISIAGAPVADRSSALALARVNASVEGYLKRRAVPAPILQKMNATRPPDLFQFGNRWLVDQKIDAEIAGHPGFMAQVARHCGPDPVAQPRPWLDCLGQLQQQSRYRLLADASAEAIAATGP